ncbi:MAG TPA: asparagine synthase (glutamine-hydrolyzing) [Candidatus Aminicenantes bacterium]|nr:asparagine synthase (glutamine-hydrolyzing) [Candidatus Aminicenantes bacterium]
MCGICGIYSFSLPFSSPPEKELRAMNQSLHHRGPDDEGYYLDDQVALAMKRLSIIDLKTGHQPLSNETQTVWVIFNGEIYNYREIRNSLIKKGHNFQTRSDTEVLVHLYEEMGVDFVEALNGMFAMALWDKARKLFLLVRDRLGIKPLHYAFHKRHLYFASEIKAILQSDFPREIDINALHQYFAFEYIPAPRTIFKNLFKLLPGHRLVAHNEEWKIEKYWDISNEKKSFSLSDQTKIIAALQANLQESVRKRLVSDVPLGVFLSGGIDSSSVTALMTQIVPEPIKTFSIGFVEESFNELQYARLVAEKYKTDHHEFIVHSEQVKELVPQLIKFLDEPLADASIIPTFIISRLARQFVTVALAGDGGDELFAGYDTYKAYKIAKYFRRLPSLIRNKIIKNIVSILPASPNRLSFEFKAKKFISGIDYPPEVANYIWWGAYHPEIRKNLFSPALTPEENPYSPIYYHLSHCPAKDELTCITYLDLKLYLQDDLLVKVDRMSMANSLEIRVPFLDHEVVEFAHQIPSPLKLKGLTTKYILKKAMEPYLPREILSRRKIGFDIPLGVWIKNELKDFVQEILSPEALQKHGFFNQKFITQILNEHFEGKHNHRQLLWPLIIFQFWYNFYLD